MKKKITLSILLIMAISLSAAFGAIGQWNTGDQYIPCYLYESVYSYPTTAIAAGANSPPGQTISFEIPPNICPPSKTIQIGGPEEGEAKNSPTYGYECSLSSDQGCCIDDYSRYYILVCGDEENPGYYRSTFRVTTYDEQGLIRTYGPHPQIQPEPNGCLKIPIYDSGRKATRFEVTNWTGGGNGADIKTVTPTIYYACCYDCRKKVGLPTTILYPKVDIENFAVAGGTTVIKDGKLLTNLALSPGTQQTFVQIENRGMFTQNDTRAKFEGLPEGVTVSITPETQKLKAKKIGTYSATFTVGPNVPSGKYQVTLVAYSEKGVFDKITFDFIVP